MEAAAEKRLSSGQIISYGLPAFGTGMMVLTLGVYLPKFYTDTLLVGPALLSWVFLFGRFWDALTDPVMGHISDHTKTRWGRRRPYFFLSALPMGVVFYFIWSPSQSLAERGLFLHLLISYIALYTFWTVFSIPYSSLGAEMSMQYHERTRLFGVRQAFGVIGTAFGIFAPIYFARLTGDDRSGYSMMAVIFGALTIVLVLIMSARVRENPEFQTREPVPFFKGLRITFRNRAFVILLIVYLLNVGGSSFLMMLTPYIGDYVIKEPWVIQYVILSFLGGFVGSLYFWVRLSRRIGKNKTWTTGMIIAAVCYLAGITYAEGTWVRWIIIAIAGGACMGCSSTIGPAVSADVVDSDEVVTGRRREGAFFGIWALLDKAAVGLAAFVGLRGLSYIGYVPNVEQTGTVIFGMKFLYCILPGVAHIIAVIIFQKFPITREVHAKIRAELDARSASKRQGQN